MLEIDEANVVFGICRDFIVNFQHNSLVQYLGSLENVGVGNNYEQIDLGCFQSHPTLSRVTFEPDSRISVLGIAAFAYCHQLRSIHIVRSVETICEKCFSCSGLQTITFEHGSRVSVLGAQAFSECSSLKSICIPSSVTLIDTECFLFCRCLSTVEVEGDCRVSRIGVNAFESCAPSLQLPSQLGRCPLRFW
jgi:hypothetical protein